MKKLFALAAASFMLLGIGACSRYETVKGDALKTKIYTLDNGLKVYMSVNKEEPRIQTYIAVKVGGKNDPKETTGLAHYFEHLMFKGTEQLGTTDYAAEKPLLDEIERLFEVYRQTTDEAERAAIYHQIDSISYEASKISIPNEYDKVMAVIGADGTNAWTSHDETVYEEDIPSNQIDNWARIQADRFRNMVIRGFHTELETIYEEKNMSLTQDSRKVWEALDQALFPHHPYGTQTVLGTQEHLKNPSITNVKKYKDQYYVPNNIAICVSGDFDPKEMVAAIEKYFGDWQPNPSIPEFTFEPEAPVTTPVVKDIYGLESERVTLGWRLPGAPDLKTTAVAEITSSILSNGQAGLIDLDVNQQQKTLSAGGGVNIQPDYSSFIVMGNPKEGQALEEVRDILLAEVAKLRSGDFDEILIEAAVNNARLGKMQALENNSSRAQLYVDAFINGIPWAEASKDIERYKTVTKDDVVAFAQKYLGAESYAIVYKHRGEDDSVIKVSAPAITPIATNRDKQSALLTEIQNTQVKPVEPVFVNFNTDMSKSQVAEGIDLLYKKNDINGIFSLSCIINAGKQTDPLLDLAARYVQYLGTSEMSAEDIATRMYELACSFGISTSSTYTQFYVSGLSENMAEAMKIFESLIAGAQPDDMILANLKNDMLRSRMNSKMNQRSCFAALQKYAMYGGEYIASSTLTNDELMAVSSEDLLGHLRDLFTNSQEMLYYGPASEAEVKSSILSGHYIASDLMPLPEAVVPTLRTDENSVVLAQYDAAQLYYNQYSDMGQKFDAAAAPEITLYNEYFGGGMNSVVFQEMREARGLAYSAYAMLRQPGFADDDYNYIAFIATQNDKLKTAVEAFDEIIENMPESEAAFSIAKEALLSRYRTQRTTGADVLNAYRACRRRGLEEPLDRLCFEKIQGMTLEDVKAAQQKWVADRNYTYCILGDIDDLDIDFLKTLGPVRTVSLDEIFGY